MLEEGRGLLQGSCLEGLPLWELSAKLVGQNGYRALRVCVCVCVFLLSALVVLAQGRRFQG